MFRISPIRMLTVAAVVAVGCLANQKSVHAEVQVDPGIPLYTRVPGISGTLKCVGSDTMSNLVTLWTESFKRQYPIVTIEIESKGSATAPPALIAGTADFGAMSRDMKNAEIDEFEKKYGYRPTAITTSLDMLAVYVHKDNPIKKLSLAEVDAIFSATRKRGFASDLRTWDQLGLTGAWAGQPISIYGRNAASGTYGYFKEHALGRGDYKDTVKEQPGSSAVVQGVASDRFAIGYSGIGYITADVRAVPLSEQADGASVAPDPQAAYTGEYPLARTLKLYVNHRPGTPLDPLRREFLRYVLSHQGQADVLKDGYLPLPPAIVRQSLAAVGIETP